MYHRFECTTGKWLPTDEEKLQVYLETTVTAERRLEISFSLEGRQKHHCGIKYVPNITGSKHGKILCQHTRTNALLRSVLYPIML